MKVRRITEEEVRSIFDYRAAEMSLRDIGSLLNLSHEAVAMVLRRDVHAGVEIPAHLIASAARNSIGPRSLRRLKGIVQAAKHHGHGYTQVEIAEMMDVTQPTISRWIKAGNEIREKME